MNRRSLLGMVVGALAAGLGLPKVALAAVAPAPKVPIAEMFVSVSEDVNAAIAGLPSTPPTLPPYSLMPAPGVPTVRIGSLMINSEAEALAFLKSMANAIREANKRIAIVRDEEALL